MPSRVDRKLQGLESRVSSLSGKLARNAASDAEQCNILTNNSIYLQDIDFRVHQLQQNVTSLALVTAPEVAQNSTALTDITNRISATEQNMSAVQQSVGAVQGVVATCACQTDVAAASTALAALTGRVAITEATLQNCARTDALATTNTAVTSLTGCVAADESVITGTATALTNLTSRVTASEATLATCAKNSDLSATNTALASTNTALTTLTGRVSAVETGNASTNSSLTSLTNRITAVEGVAVAAARATDLTVTNTNVSNLTASLTSTQNTLNARITNVENTLPTYAKTGDLNTTNSSVVGLTARVTTAESSLTAQDTRLKNIESTSVNDVMRGWVTTPSNGPLRNSKIISMAVDPTSGTVMMVDAQGYVYRTYDGGATIAQVYSVSAAATIRITFGNGIWVICRHASPIIYSTNGGTTWQTHTVSASGILYNLPTNQWLYVSITSTSRDLTIGTMAGDLTSPSPSTYGSLFATTGITLIDMCLNGGGSYVVLLFSSNAGVAALTIIQNPLSITSLSQWNGWGGGFAGFTSVTYSPASDIFVIATTTAGAFYVSGRTSSTVMTDPNTWTIVSVPDLIGVPRCIGYSGTTNTFVAAGDVGNKQTAVVYRTNGTSWSPSYTYTMDTRVPSSIVYDTTNELWMIGAYVSGSAATVFSSTPFPSSYTHRKLDSTSASLKTLTANYNSTASQVSTNASQLSTLTSQLASGFCSTLNDNIYYSMIGLGPISTQVNIEYHWTRVMDTVSLTGRVIVPGPVETTVGTSTGYIKFKLPMAISGTFSSPGQVTYTYNPGTATSMTKFNPRLLGHVFMDNKTQQALVDSWEIYGEPGTNNVATIFVNDNSTYSNACFWFQISYKLSSISYSTTITNQLTNTVAATI